MRYLLVISFLIVGCGAVCGNAILEAEEACDDGNNIDADGCEANCSLPACGNGIIDPGEICLGAPLEIFNGQSGFDIITGDFDNDGFLDLAAPAGTAVSLYFNEKGTFSEETRFELEAFSEALAAADFNKDGFLDLAATLLFSDQISVLSGNGQRGFFEDVRSSTQAVPFGIVATDLNQNGEIDLAVTHDTGATLGVFERNLAGQFSLEQVFPLAGTGSLSIVAAHLNEDLFPDLIVGVAAEDIVTIFLNNGAGAFFEAPPLSIENPFAIKTLDFNEDGILDLAIGTNSKDVLVLFEGKGKGTFSLFQEIDIDDPIDLDIGDMNQDGVPDIVVGNRFGEKASQVSLLLQQEDGFFSLGPVFEISDRQAINALVLGDFTNDGVPDVALSLTESVAILESTP